MFRWRKPCRWSSHLLNPPRATLEPRKSPVQERSTASVDAILEATIQVLLDAVKEGLTTTNVAARAGVSIGTLYQYFPNKSSLLQAALKQHLDEVIKVVEQVCRESMGKSLSQMAASLICAFLSAKMRHPKASAALYAVSADVEGTRLAKQMGLQSSHAIAEMLNSAREPLCKNPQLVATTLYGAMSGVSRKLLESQDPEGQLAPLRDELIELACAYVQTCSMKAAV